MVPTPKTVTYIETLEESCTALQNILDRQRIHEADFIARLFSIIANGTGIAISVPVKQNGFTDLRACETAALQVNEVIKAGLSQDAKVLISLTAPDPVLALQHVPIGFDIHEAAAVIAGAIGWPSTLSIAYPNGNDLKLIRTQNGRVTIMYALYECGYPPEQISTIFNISTYQVNMIVLGAQKNTNSDPVALNRMQGIIAMIPSLCELHKLL